jgi:translation elongation factor EF-1alpha
MFIPLSGLTGANVKDRVSPDACDWWDKMIAEGENNTKQGTLLEILNELHMVRTGTTSITTATATAELVHRSIVRLSRIN